jgi:hypothetical protein
MLRNHTLEVKKMLKGAPSVDFKKKEIDVPLIEPV